ERIRREPADVAVLLELAPGPAFFGRFVHHDALALERLGIKRRIRHGLAAHWRQRIDHLLQFAGDVASGRNSSFKKLGRNVGPRRRDARVEIHRGSPCALVTRRSPSRSTWSAPFTVRWTITLRRSRSSRRRSTRSSLPIESSARVITGLVTRSLAARPRTVC